MVLLEEAELDSVNAAASYAQVFDEFVRYVAQFDAGFPGRIKAASRASIERLQELVAPTVLPPVYVAFLERMGADHGGFNITGVGTTSIDDIINDYLTFLEAEDEESMAAGCVMIGSAGLQSIGLRLRPPVVEPEVVLMDDISLPSHTLAESLPKFLFQQAFDKYRWRSFPTTGTFSAAGRRGDPNRTPEFEQIATRRGFARLWFSDAHRFCGELGQDAAISAVHWETHGPWLKVSASSRWRVFRLARPFRKAAGLRFGQWSDVGKAMEWDEQQRMKHRSGVSA